MQTLVSSESVVLTQLLERLLIALGHRVVTCVAAGIEAAGPIDWERLDTIFVASSDPALSVRELRAKVGPSPYLSVVLSQGEDAMAVVQAGADDYFLQDENIAARLELADARARERRACRDTRAKLEGWRALLDSRREWIVELDPSGTILSSNRLDDAPPGLIGTNVLDWLSSPEQKANYAAALVRVREELKPQHFETRAGRALVTWYDVVLTPIMARGRLASIGVVARDMTEIRRATEVAARSEARMRENEATFRLFIERMPDAVLLHREGRIIWANAACVAALGFSVVSELIDQPLLSFVAEESRAVASEQIQAPTGASLATAPIELGIVRKDGSRGIVELARVSWVEVDGGPAALVVARDVTQYREQQERRLASERLASMGSLAACIAHEINNPLTYVIGNLSFLARVLSEYIDESSRSTALHVALADAREGVERVRRTVGALTTLAQPEAGASENVEIRKLVESTLNVASNEIRHRARVERSLADVPPVRASEVRLGQLFLELFLLAARTIAEGAASEHTLSVSTRRGPGGFVIVEVRMRGRGPYPPISVEQEPSLAENLARSLDGKLLSEALADGTRTWTLWLPAATGEEQDAGEASGEKEREPRAGVPRRSSIIGAEGRPRTRPEPGAEARLRARILVVDDEPVIASTMRRALDNHEIYVVTSGRDALELCREQSFDLVLCDLMMPDLTGMDLYEQLQRDVPGREQQIIFMTGGAFTVRARSFLARIPNVWVEKPFDVDRIQILVDEFLRRRAGDDGASSSSVSHPKPSGDGATETPGTTAQGRR